MPTPGIILGGGLTMKTLEAFKTGIAFIRVKGLPQL